MDIWTAAADGNIEAVRKHLAAGVDVNAKTDDQISGTPLHLVAILGHKEVAELLVDAGADVNAKDGGGWTPLHFAARHKSYTVFTISLIWERYKKSWIKNDGYIC